jgi:hypothetical protein
MPPPEICRKRMQGVSNSAAVLAHAVSSVNLNTHKTCCMYVQQRSSLTVQSSKLARPVFCAVGAAAFDWQNNSKGRPGGRTAAAAATTAAGGGETRLEQLLRARRVVLGCFAASTHASTPLLQESAVASCTQPQQLPPTSTACQRPSNDAHTQHQRCLNL